MRFPGADVEKTQGPIGGDPREAFESELKAIKARCDPPMETGQCGNARAMCDEEIVAELFKYHAPNDFTIPKYAAINQAAKNFAEIVLANCPRGKDRSNAIELIRLARMTANAAVSLNGLSLY